MIEAGLILIVSGVALTVVGVATRAVVIPLI